MSLIYVHTFKYEEYHRLQDIIPTLLSCRVKIVFHYQHTCVIFIGYIINSSVLICKDFDTVSFEGRNIDDVILLQNSLNDYIII